MSCPFCPANWHRLHIVQQVSGAQLTGRHGLMNIITPLNPVVEGHVLVIHERHSSDLSDDLFVAGQVMTAAAHYVRQQGIQANIITSIGPAATQTVMHTHVHVVPRSEGDGLPLPWTPQQFAAERGEATNA